MKNSLILSFLILVLFYSCSTNQPSQLTEEQKAQIKQEVIAQYKNAISNASAMNMEAWSEPWNKDDFICVNSGAYHFNTFQEYKDSITQWFSVRESQKVEIQQTNAEVLAANLVLITSTTDWDIVFMGGTNMNVKLLVSALWKKDDDSWKMIFVHESY